MLLNFGDDGSIFLGGDGVRTAIFSAVFLVLLLAFSAVFPFGFWLALAFVFAFAPPARARFELAAFIIVDLRDSSAPLSPQCGGQ